MRRKNHRRHVKTKAFPSFIAISAMLAMLLAVGYGHLHSACAQLGNALGQGEREIENLNKTLQSESIRWKDNFTSEKIRAALRNHGLKMDYPSLDQIVRMDKKGRPVENQLSMNNFRKNRQTQTSVAGR